MDILGGVFLTKKGINLYASCCFLCKIFLSPTGFVEAC